MNSFETFVKMFLITDIRNRFAFMRCVFVTRSYQFSKWRKLYDDEDDNNDDAMMMTVMMMMIMMMMMMTIIIIIIDENDDHDIK